MPRKQIWVREEAMGLWEEAEALADADSISALVEEALTEFVAMKKRSAEEHEDPYEVVNLRVAVFAEDDEIDGSKPVTFRGRRVAREGDTFVYQTARERVAFYYPHPKDNWFFCLEDYDSLNEAAKATKNVNGKKVPKFSSSLLADAARVLYGADWVEELDI